MKQRLPIWPLIYLLCFAANFCATLRTAHAQANRDNFGTEFYLAWGSNMGGERDVDTRNYYPLYITSKVVAHGKVEVPALGFYRTFTTAPGTITTIDLPNGNQGTSTVELRDSEVIIKGMAIHVTSDSQVAVFGLNHKLYSSDAFMGLPVNVLGTEYRTINYVSSGYGGRYAQPSEFWIISPFDSTNVTITLRDYSGRGTPPNVPINVRMNKGDIYMVKGAEVRSNDLTGSHIESDYPIAVFSGHMRTQIPSNAVDANGTPSRDHLCEQLPPVSAWGDSAYVVPYATSARPDLVRVIAAEDGTTITVNGVAVPKTLNAGDFYEITQLQGVTAIQASRPIMVGQYMHTSAGSLGDPQDPAYGDPALALVYPVEQFATAYTIVSVPDQSSFTGNYVNIVVDEKGANSMTIDGTPIPSREFQPIPGTHYVYAQHELQQGTHNLLGTLPFGITIYGLGPVDSYSYPGGSLLKTITPLKTVNQIIDFGDRVLGPAPGLAGSFDTTVYLENISTDVVNIFGFPKRIQDTGKFDVIKPTPSQSAPDVIQPSTSDSITIRFTPAELNRRMHTQITAKTDHLRAYVVDVYGRGVADEMGLFRDEPKTTVIDTLDFGVFEAIDPAADSVFYIGNAGLVNLRVSSIALGGADQASFVLGATSEAQLPVTVPFDITKAPSQPAAVRVTFTPGGANGIRIASVTVKSFSGSTHIVILKARIETITPLTAPTAAAFDTTTVCQSKDIVISIPNPNDLPIQLLDATIAGQNQGDFVVASPLPMVIPAGGVGTIKFTFLPSARGLRRATASLSFDLPKHHAPQVIALSGVSDKHTLEFSGQLGVPASGTQTFMVPIYATTDLTQFGGIGYTMHISYDSAHLELLDIFTQNTLATSGTATLFAHRGADTIMFTPLNDQPIVGGGPGSLPLVFLKFVPHLEIEDPTTFTATYNIAYDVDLTSPKIPARCADNLFNAATVRISSICGDAQLAREGSIPGSMMLEQNTPNPFKSTTTIQYDVATEGPITIAAYDPQGNRLRTLVDEVKKPGYYTLTLNGSDFPSGAYMIRMEAGDYKRMRKVILQK